MKNGGEGKPYSHNKSSVDDYFLNILKCLLRHVAYSSETQLQSYGRSFREVNFRNKMFNKLTLSQVDTFTT